MFGKPFLLSLSLPPVGAGLGRGICARFSRKAPFLSLCVCLCGRSGGGREEEALPSLAHTLYFAPKQVEGSRAPQKPEIDGRLAGQTLPQARPSCGEPRQKTTRPTTRRDQEVVAFRTRGPKLLVRISSLGCASLQWLCGPGGGTFIKASTGSPPPAGI